MKHDDSSLPTTAENAAQAPTDEMTAWQAEREPSLCIKVWLTDKGRQLVAVRYAEELPALLGQRDLAGMTEALEAATSIHRTVDTVLIALRTIVLEREVMAGVQGDN